MTDHRNTTPIYRRLARLMAMLPATTKGIAEETGVTQRGLGLWTRHLRAEGIIGYGAMRQREGRLIVPGNGHRYALAKIEASAGVQTWCRAWHALAARQTSDSLAAVLGIGRRTACDLLRQLRLNGLIRVGGWEVRGQSYAPVWDRLPAPDVPKPGREPRTEINARFWAARRERIAANPPPGPRSPRADFSRFVIMGGTPLCPQRLTEAPEQPAPERKVHAPVRGM